MADVQEHVLLAIPFPEPPGWLEGMRVKFPKVKFTYHPLPKVLWNTDQLDDEIYKDVTILVNLTALPSGSEAAPRLRLVHACMAGTSHWEKHPLYQNPNIIFTNSSGVQSPTIAEWVTMTLLISNRKYNILHDWQQERVWGNGHDANGPFWKQSATAGKRMAILGYGSIGRQVARIAKALGMEVIAYTASPRATPESRRDDGYLVPGTGDPEGLIPSQWFSGGSKEDIHRFLSQDVDYLVLSVPLTKKTKNLIGKEEFDVLSKKHTFLLNVSRGDVLVQDELIKSLKAFESSEGEEGIRGAAIDVAIPEPLPKDSELWDAPNLTITPHISGITGDHAKLCLDVFEQNLYRIEEGRRLLNIVDREKGYASNAPG